ncbi:MAG TPA: hypothetical protein VKU86_04860 [Acidimicrobiales bacterium]|nr:hypothetical protein [Acidimicrobiales bacterium]
MKRKLLGLGFGMALSTVGVVVAPAVAFADSTCYTGCSTPNTGSTPVTPSAPAAAQTQPPSEPASGGLPFTGADIAEMTAVGAGAVLVGGVLVQRSRRQRQANA